MTEGLHCTTRLPFTWQATTLDPAERQRLLREAALLLSAINQMEGSRELEGGGADGRRSERLEAKLDLALHLLVRVLEPGPGPTAGEITLSPHTAEWPAVSPPSAGREGVLEIRFSEQLPISLRLPALAREPLPGVARVRFENLPEALDDALHQWVFRRQREAIRARASST